MLEETKYDTVSVLGYPEAGGSEPEVDAVNKLETPKLAGKEHTSQMIGYIDENQPLRSRAVEIDHTIPMKGYQERLRFYTNSSNSTGGFWVHFYQPFLILCLFPAVAFTALQYGFSLCVLSILAVTQADLFVLPPYNFSSIGIGNLNIAPAIGAILGSLYGGPLNDWAVVRLAKRNGGIYEPEMRLYLFFLPGICMPIGIFWYGFTTAKVRLT